MDIHAAGTHAIGWTSAFDNPYDFNPIVSVPDELGLTIDLTGVDPVITTLVAGTWSLLLQQNFPTDATFEGVFGSGFGPMNTTVKPDTVDTQLTAVGCVVANLPIAAEISFSVSTGVASTANPYTVGQFLANIVRLA
jgi:hypothetical protein